MAFPPEFLDELRARLPVSEVVGRRVKLKKAGREWKGLSPFNQEKTPSFFVYDQMAGMPMPAVSPEAVRQEERRRTLYDVVELAAKFFEQTLASRVGAKARGY